MDMITKGAGSPSNSSSSTSSAKYLDYLQKASDSSPSILLELDMAGTINYISDVWDNVVGTTSKTLIGTPISNILVGTQHDKEVFQRAISIMLKDDASYKVKFVVNTPKDNDDDINLSDAIDTDDDISHLLELEAQGILIHDIKTHKPLHSMWIIKPFYEIDELDNLPIELVTKLGFGAIIFQQYLDLIESLMVMDELTMPPPKQEFCHICETVVVAWWLEAHSQLCLCEHNLETNIQLLHDEITEQKGKLKELKDLLVDSNNNNNTPNTLIVTLGQESFEIDTSMCDNNTYVVIDTILNLCQDAIDINMSELKSDDNNGTTNNILLNNRNNIEYKFSPKTKKNLEQVNNWNSRLETLRGSLKSDGLKQFCNAIVQTTRRKVVEILRLDNAQKCSLKLKNEVDIFVLELIKQRIESNKLNYNAINNTSILETCNNNNNNNTIAVAATNTTNANNNNSNNNNIYNSTSSSPLSSSLYTVDNTSLVPIIQSPIPKKLQKQIFSDAYVKNNEQGILPVKSQSYRQQNTNNNKKENDKNAQDSYFEKEETNKPIKTSSVMDQHTTNSPTASETSNNNDKCNLINNLNNNNNTTNNRNNTIRNNHFTEKSNSVTSFRELSPKTESDGTPIIQKTFPLGSQSSRTNLEKLLTDYTASSTSLSSKNSTNAFGVMRSSSVHKLNNGTLSTTPRRGSPLLVSANTPLSIIQKNPTAKSVMEKSPMVSPFQHPLDPSINASGNASSNNYPNSSLSPLLLATNPPNTVRSSSSPRIVDYDIIKPISKGAFGSVYLAKRKLTGDYFAIKVLKKSDMISKNQVTNVKEERAIMMSQSNKPYVAKLYATFQNKDNLFLVMEYLSGGDIASLLKVMGTLPDEWTKQYISEVVVGVEDMHKDGIIHHDLKPDNLLIDSKGHVKLTDFGLSRRGLVNRQRKALANVGTSFPSSLSTPISSNLAATSILVANSRSRSIDNTSRRSSVSSVLDDTNNNCNIHGNTNNNTLMSPTSAGPPNVEGLPSSNITPSGILEAPMLKRTDSHVSFSINHNDIISRANSPPPFSLTLGSGKLRKSSANSDNSDITGHSTLNDLVIYDLHDSNRQNKKFLGTPDYLAPETISGTGESAASDWWSVGCILFELLLGYPPFHASSPQQVFKNILTGKIDWPTFPDQETEREFLSPDAKDLITKLLVLVPQQRLGSNGVEEIKAHPYFKDVDWTQVYDEEASFVPVQDNPENTDYFDLRGATMDLDFESLDDDISHLETQQHQSENLRPDSSLPGVNNNPSSVSSMLESFDHDSSSSSSNMAMLNLLSPSAITSYSPRERRGSKLSENQTEFGSFNFRNIIALDKANKDVIHRLKTEHLSEQQPFIFQRGQSLSVGSDSSTKLLKSSFSSLRSSFSKSHSPIRRDSNDSNKGSSNLSHTINSKKPLINISDQYTEEDNSSSAGSTPKFKSPMSPSVANLNLGVKPKELSILVTDSSTSTVQSASINSEVNSSEDARFNALSKLNTVRKSRRRSYRRTSSTDENNVGAPVLKFDLDILLCEPIPIHNYGMVKNLKSLGCRVVSVSSGDELVRRATSDVKFDIIFTTLKLPKLDAIDIVKLLRNTNGANCNTSIVATTVFSNEAAKLGIFDDVIEKPIMLNTLSKILSKYALKKMQDDEDTIISDAESDAFYDASSND
ncbi:uncharacterized protein SCODWIG_01917 [Saccharomycodes ludwigii]|uniref:non-specific serine/threonine protein kinase n=1 Tax=Saccharomycodes ludwigii TaxID=36035 RepID=A0A376B627_9ASCO|nr:hypothetical protein SCDLUD_000650 [Saccharomycodes ludwigii]KAH3903040.1 hypothetical protein SCDLUD_000650 [Saccharomycodes ludwigii]SSD60156.1 uncharacterized protein SCODWIG_01917 [Saccharomycodes ludwigii]